MRRNRTRLRSRHTVGGRVPGGLQADSQIHRERAAVRFWANTLCLACLEALGRALGKGAYILWAFSLSDQFLSDLLHRYSCNIAHKFNIILCL